MSLNRLRRLAGLTESFTPDPELNAEIEREVNAQATGTRHDWMDILETIYDAGEHGISREEIADRMNGLNANKWRLADGGYLEEMMNEIVHRFANMVEADHDLERFRWIGGSQAEPDIEDEVDPATRTAMGNQVTMSSHALAAMREMTASQNGFTAQELAQRLSQTIHLPPVVARQYAMHMIEQFRSMLGQEGERYVFREEPPQKTDVQFFRDLEAQARRSPPPDLEL